MLKQLCLETRHLNAEFFEKVEKTLSKMETMKELGTLIDSTIDFESSKEEACIIVKEGVDNVTLLPVSFLIVMYSCHNRRWMH